MKLSRRHALTLVAALPAACASPNPTLYTLATVPGETRSGAPKLIELRQLALPHYLERSEIVRSTENYRLDLLPNDWWGESLSSMMNRVLVQNLSQRLPDSTVVSEVGAISGTPDATVGINVLRFDADHSGVEVLDAQISITGDVSVTKRVHLTIPLAAPGTPGLVSAMSAAVGRLADVVASMLTEKHRRSRRR